LWSKAREGKTMLNEETDLYEEGNSEEQLPADEEADLAESEAEASAELVPLRASRPRRDAHYAEDRDYLEVLRDMQQGQWERVVPMLRALLARYPDAAELEALLQEATFRSSMESNWGDKVKGVQPFQLPIKSLMAIIPVVVVVALLIGGVIFYGKIQRVNALSDQQQEILSQAQSALAAGQYRDALDLFDTVLAEEPKHAEALKGQGETRRQMKLANDYQLAIDRISSGNYQQAMELLAALQVEAPGYRDVAARIEELKAQTGAPQIFADAEFAFTNKLWLSAVVQYEQLRQLDESYEMDLVRDRLATAYLGAGQQIVSVRPGDSTLIKQAQEYFDKSLQMNANQVAAKTENQMLDAFMAAESMVQQESYEQGAQTLSEIYDKRPAYFGGYVAELLFRAYIGLGERAVQQGNLERAQVAYTRAIELGFDSNGAAQQRLTEITALLAPPPAAVAAPVGNAAPAVAAAPVEPPAPVDPLAQYRGWIAFRSNRNGGELYYIMKPDGSEQQPAPMELIQKMNDLYKQQQWSPDGQQLLYVHHVSEQASTNIFKVRSDLPSTWDRDIMLTDYVGTEYDPVWSPDGRAIAFVSNHTGNDEIWVMDAEGGNHRQLTSNGWQWDKHPSFSPDGSQIVFYSNSSGARQIWNMNADGGNQRNISSNDSEDWDPVWIR
jgi:TolB protein